MSETERDRPDAAESGRAVARMVRWGLDARVVAWVQRELGPVDDPAAWRTAGRTWDVRAEGARAAGHTVTAANWSQQAFFCNRLAESRYLDDSPEQLEAYAAALASFDLATLVLEPRLRRVAVPFEGVDYPALFLAPPGGRVPAALVLYGADGSKEEHLWASMHPYEQRGVAVLLVDGPGHGWVRRMLGIGAVPDFERFGRACLDVLQAQPEVDPGRLALSGSSLSGYYAARLFAADDRLRACVINSAVFDVAAGFWDTFPPIRPQLQYLIGAQTPDEARARLAGFTLHDIRPTSRPLRIYHGADDRMIPPGEAERVRQAVGPAADVVLWPDASHNLGNVGVEAHPHVWDWLADQLHR